MILKGYLFSLLYGMFCILASALAHRMGVKSVYTRKITHILVGFEWVILNHYFGASIHFLIICLVFTLVICILHKTKLVPSLSSDEENSLGTIYYCIAMTVMSAIVLIFPEMMIPFGVGVVCTSVGDGFAGVIGQIKKHNIVIYGKKTLFGFLSCFILSVASIFILLSAYKVEINPFYVILVSLFAAELELFAQKGIDNITVTIGSAFLSFLFISFPSLILYYIAPILLTLPIVVLVYEKKALTKAGIILAIALDLVASIAFGNIGFVILIGFFGGSLIADKLKKRGKEHKKPRNAIQVLANGSLGIVFGILYLIFNSSIFLVAFASVFSEALADTASSGIGSRSEKAFDVFRMKKVSAGTSGGISLIGTLSSLISAALIAGISAISPEIGFIEALIVLTSGFLGSIFDSLLGSLLQGKYKCSICGEETEERVHCNEKTTKISGLEWMNNSAVNFFSTLFASVVSIILSLII